MSLKKVSGAIVLGALALAFVAGPAFAQNGKDKGAAPKMDAAAEASMMAEAMKMAVSARSKKPAVKPAAGTTSR